MGQQMGQQVRQQSGQRVGQQAGQHVGQQVGQQVRQVKLFFEIVGWTEDSTAGDTACMPLYCMHAGMLHVCLHAACMRARCMHACSPAGCVQGRPAGNTATGTRGTTITPQPCPSHVAHPSPCIPHPQLHLLCQEHGNMQRLK